MSGSCPRLFLLRLAGLVAMLPATAHGGSGPVPGPVEAETVEIVDGDTIRVRAHIWLDVTVEVLVRIRGIDAPELRGACPEERAGAEAATLHLAAVTPELVLLTDVEDDKYAGRVVANVATATGIELGPAMLASGLARPYDGASRESWCPAVVAATQ